MPCYASVHDFAVDDLIITCHMTGVALTDKTDKVSRSSLLKFASSFATTPSRPTATRHFLAISLTFLIDIQDMTINAKGGTEGITYRRVRYCVRRIPDRGP